MKQWKALTALVLCLILALSLVPASAWAAEEAPASASWADGTYEGTGAGFGGDVVVSVTILDGAIASIEVLSHEGENFWVVYETELNEMVSAIQAADSTDVDAVSPDTPCTRAQIVTFLDRATAG